MSLLVCLNFISTIDKMVIPLKYQQNRFMQPQTTQYLHDISILRVAAMLMVVFYHCLCPYSIWKWKAYSIGFQVPLWETIDNMLLQLHLPIFFLISGYLYGCKRILGGTLTQGCLCLARRRECYCHTSLSEYSSVCYKIETWHRSSTE